MIRGEKTQSGWASRCINEKLPWLRSRVAAAANESDWGTGGWNWSWGEWERMII